MSAVPTWPRPWLARCVCGPVARSATSAGALVHAEAHRARHKGHIVEVLHDPEPTAQPTDTGRSGLILLVVIAVVILVAGGVATGLSRAVDNLDRPWTHDSTTCTGYGCQDGQP